MHINEANYYVSTMRKHQRNMRIAFRFVESAVSIGDMNEIREADVKYAETVRAAWEDAGTLSRNILTDAMNRYKE